MQDEKSDPKGSRPSESSHTSPEPSQVQEQPGTSADPLPTNQNPVGIKEPGARGYEDPHNKPRYLVAIGASAGGLEALERLLEGLPDDTGAAFVIIQHLSPDFKSLLGDLLSRRARMPVINIEQGQPLHH